jgi:excisionase family DNA binding protein
MARYVNVRAHMADYYTTGEAAKLLGVGDSRIRQMLLAGELEGERDPVSDRWRIPQHAVLARRVERRPEAPPKVSPIDAVDWLEKVEALRQELGRLEGRLQITEVAESTLRESLERERERADRLESELRDGRSKGFWERLFGG